MNDFEKHKELLRKQEEGPKLEKALQLVANKVEISAYRNERNLMLFPFCSTSRKTRFTPIEYRTSDGKRWLEVSPNVKHGMVKIWDFDVLRYALSKAGEIARFEGATFPPHVEFSAYECLKAIGRSPKGKAGHEWLKKAIKRLAHTAYSGNIFRENENITTEFHLIEAEYRVESDGKLGNIKIKFNERLIDSARYAKGLLEIDPKVINENSGLKKRLLELVKTGMGNTKEWTVGLGKLKDLCASERQMKHFKNDLQNINDLPWEVLFFPKIGGGENIKFSKKD